MIKAPPLGGVTGYQYKQRELSLASGDVVVLMSDGLPERFNEQGEMLDYQKVHDTLLTVTRQTPQAIIDRLVKAGDEWGGGRAQDDDVTFVVVKVR
jgi:serine phosphatase RsbU (regulator of sigma subunit)